jgi:putative hydrolase of the HAD superfamily
MPPAILFDLYDTLVPGTHSGRRAMMKAMGVDLGLDPDQFAWEVAHAWPQRMRGVFGDVPTELRVLASRLGGSPSDEAVATAVERRLAFNRRVIDPDPGAIEVLHALRSAGWRIAIVSNCTFDSAMALREKTELVDAVDALVLSCELHFAKPDPAIYRAACDALGVEDPSAAVFVGDGADHELRGAAVLGIRVIQTTQFGTSDPSWAGERVGSLTELLPILAPTTIG